MSLTPREFPRLEAPADRERSSSVPGPNDADTGGSPCRSRFWAVIPAAGQGTRMADTLPKQYLPLAGGTVIERTVDIFTQHPRCMGVVVAIAGDDSVWPTLAPRWEDKVRAVEGGSVRAESVLAGLISLEHRAGGSEWVLVHDAARPCLESADIDRLMEAVGGDENGGLLALPATDTLKRVDAGHRVKETVPRHDIWRALTPQMFRLRTLRGAVEAALAAGVDVTDEASAMERLGYRPLLVPASNENIKITRPPDLARAAQLLGCDPA